MNDLPTPLSRVDLYLAVAAGMEGVTLPEKPLSRLEQFLAVIAGDTTVELPIPASLTELWLNYVAGGALTSEMKLEGAYWVGAQKVDVRFFAVAGGMEGVTLPEAQNRTEQYWARIAEIRPIHGVLKYATGTSITLTDVVSGITSLENVYGDTFQQTYTGKNLYNSPDRSQTRYDITAAIVNNRVTISGTATRNNFGGTYFNVNGTDYAYANYYNYDNTTSGITLAAGTYTLSLNNVTGSYTTPSLVQMFVCGVYSGSYPIPTLATITLTNDQTSATFTISEETTVKIQFRVQVSSDTSVAVPVFNNYSFDLQLESGSTATSYEPYVGGTASPNPDYPQDVQVVTGTQTVTVSDGVNSHDYTINLKTANLFDSATVINGTLQANGTVNTGATGYSTTDFIEIDSSLPIIKTATGSPRVKLYDSSKNVISAAQYNDIPNFNTSGSHDITYKNAKYIRFSIYLADFPLDGVNIYQPIELAKIGTYQDYIYKSGDDWYVHKELGKMTFDGSESWGTNSPWNYDNTSIYILSGTGNSIASPTISDYFTYSSSVYALDTNGIFGIVWTNRAAFRVSNTIASTTTDWKTWLSTHNTTVYYAIATPTDTQITDSTLVAQLNAINSAVLPKPVAYITVGSNNPNLPASIKISYYGEEE